MSNTAEVTPYVSADSGSACGEALVEFFAAFAMTDAEKATIERYEEAQRQQRLSVSRISLRNSDLQPLLRAAQAEGFTPVRLAGGRTCDLGRPLELQNRQGERLAVQLIGNVATVVSTNGLPPTHSIVRRCSLESVRQHLESFAGSQAVSHTLPNGETEFRAVEAKKKADGAAAITARIGASGVANVDISNIRGGRCEKVLRDLAVAAGGTVRNKKFKPDFYEEPNEPGEPARVRLKR